MNDEHLAPQSLASSQAGRHDLARDGDRLLVSVCKAWKLNPFQVLVPVSPIVDVEVEAHSILGRSNVARL